MAVGVRCLLVVILDLVEHMKFVMAGNYGEYRFWCREQGIKHWDHSQVIYLSDFMSLQGRIIYDDDELIKVGTSYNNRAYNANFSGILKTRMRKGNRP